CVRARPRRFLTWFNHLQLLAPLVQAPRPYPEFSRQLTDIFTSLHALDGHSLKFPGVSLSLHLCFLSRKLCPILCVTSRVHSNAARNLPHYFWLPVNRGLRCGGALQPACSPELRPCRNDGRMVSKTYLS